MPLVSPQSVADLAMVVTEANALDLDCVTVPVSTATQVFFAQLQSVLGAVVMGLVILPIFVIVLEQALKVTIVRFLSVQWDADLEHVSVLKFVIALALALRALLANYQFVILQHVYEECALPQTPATAPEQALLLGGQERIATLRYVYNIFI